MILKENDPKNVYADETGVFFHCLPDKTLEFKDKDCHGGKHNKERLTAMVCASMSGTDKHTLLVLGRSEEPRCFNHVNSVPKEYDANKKAWMTSEIFTKWVTKFHKFCQSDSGQLPRSSQGERTEECDLVLLASKYHKQDTANRPGRYSQSEAQLQKAGYRPSPPLY